MYSLVMQDNPSNFKDGPEAITVNIGGKQIKMQPDHPAERVSWDDTQIFINKLNELSLKDDPLLYKIIPDHKRGDRYRLPTEAEWEFVVKDRGRANRKWHFGDDESKLPKYAWFDANSGNTTHAVAQLKPLIIDGHAFYDLYGNVWEWVQDWLGSYPSDIVVDPGGPATGSDRVFRGGGWDDFARGCRSAYRYNYSSGYRYDGLGFRLARARGP
jgi:formylglycine-generating enzyme required for sulfatase activity